jgi:hypothetical protein
MDRIVFFIRADMEDEYAKKLLKVAKTSPLGKEETG